MAENQQKNAPQKIQQTVENAQDVKKGVKDAVSAVKNYKTGNWAGAAKDAVKVLKNKKFKKNAFIMGIAGILIPVIIISVIAGGFMAIIEGITDAVNDFISAISSSITRSWSDPVDGKITIEIDKDKYKELKESLKGQSINTESAGLTDECIKIFLLAEYATQYPDDVKIKIEVTPEEKQTINRIGMGKYLKSENGKDYIEATGCVKLYRPEFASGKLQLTDMATLEKYEKKEDNISFDDVKGKYALDKSGSIVIPEIETEKVIEGEDELKPTETEVNLHQDINEDDFDWETFNKRSPTQPIEETRSLNKLPYKSEIAIYTMPYEFLAQLTSFTNCTEYGLAVAALVTDKTDIKINILDDSKTTEQRYTKAYNRTHDVEFTAGAKIKLMNAGLWGSGVHQSQHRSDLNDKLEDQQIGPTVYETRKKEFYKYDYNRENEYVYDEFHINDHNQSFSSGEPHIHEIRKNTITTQYTSQIQVEKGESWFVKKTTAYQIEKKEAKLDESIQRNPAVNDLDPMNILNWVVPEYDSLSKIYENEPNFREFIEKYNIDIGKNGSSIEYFKNKLEVMYDKDDMVDFAKRYSEEDIRKKYIETVLHQDYSRYAPGEQILPRDTSERFKITNMKNAIDAYKEMNADWMIDKNSYEYLPKRLKMTGEDVQERTAVYVSEKIYNVNNVGDAVDNTDEFIKLLVTGSGEEKKPVYYHSALQGKTAPVNSLISAPEMFFQILADNDKTANLEDPMRYIMHKITGIDYGVTDFKKALFSLQNFGTGDILYDYIRIWENDDLYRYYAGISPTSQYVKNNRYLTEMCPDDAGGSVYLITYGVVLVYADGSPHSENIETLNQFNKNITEDLVLRKYNKAGVEFTELTPEQLERAFEKIVDKFKQQVEREVKDLNLSEDQINALTIIMYQCGNIDGFRDAYQLYKDGKIEEFKSTFKNGKAFKYGLEASGSAYSTERAESIWRAFSEGYYARESEGLILDKRNYKKAKKGSGKLAAVIDYAQSNMGKTGSDMGVDFAWCAWYVKHCFAHEGYDASMLYDGDMVSTRAALEYASQGKFKKKEEGYIPQCGDIILYGPEGNLKHTGMVIESDGVQVHTIEGNTLRWYSR